MYINRYKKIIFNENIVRIVKLVILGNYAKSMPPISVILAYYKVEVKKFCDEFNKETKKKYLNKLPLKVTIYIYKDETYRYFLEYPPITFLIKNILKFKKKNYLTYLDIYKITLIKQCDNSNTLLKFITKTVIATIFSMKLKIKN